MEKYHLFMNRINILNKVCDESLIVSTYTFNETARSSAHLMHKNYLLKVSYYLVISKGYVFAYIRC